MVRRIIIGIGIIVILVIAYFAYMVAITRSHSPQDTVNYEGENVSLEVVYCQPYKKDRLIFGEEEEGALVPYGEYWRTGANESTEIEFSDDVLFVGTRVDAGRYRLYTVPNEATWQVVLNSELGTWGYYEPDDSKDVLNVEVPATNNNTPVVEQFTIRTEAKNKGVNLIMEWDKTQVIIPIEGLD